MEGQVAVRIKALAKIPYGEDLLVCGSVPQLGSWKLCDAAQMHCEGQVWYLATRLPCGVRVELKLVQRPQGGQVHWHGGGPGGSANLVLETSIGRIGAQGSRFLSLDGFPWHLDVEDLGPEEAQSLLEHDHPESTGATSPPPGAAPAAAPGPVALVSPMAAPMPEAWSKELLLTGHAAAAGHAVTYTTTTTTTTAVTINGAAASPGAAFTPQAPAGPPIEYAPQAAPGQPPASPSGPGGPGGGGREKALPAPEPTEEDMKAMVAARQLNNGIPRAGPLPLQWSSSSPRDVRVRGSWDGWKRDLALEPCPGVGFRVMLVLPAGEYEFKFIVDGTWTTSDEMEQTKCANRNNVATVNEMVLVPVPLTKADAKAEENNTLALEGGNLAIEAGSFL